MTRRPNLLKSYQCNSCKLYFRTYGAIYHHNCKLADFQQSKASRVGNICRIGNNAALNPRIVNLSYPRSEK